MSSPASPPLPRRLSRLEKASLSAEILAAYAAVRVQLRRRDLRGALARLRGDRDLAVDSGESHHAEALHLGRVVGRVLRLVPADSRCLMQALVLTRLLAKRGLGSSLVIGVRSGERFGAHAWVELEGRPLLPPGGGVYERLVEL